MAPRLQVAVVGSGIAGLAAAHVLADHADVSLFEAGSYFGGHTHTVDVRLPTAAGPVTHGVDTGFLVFNERTYPQLIALFDELGVARAKSDMSFSVQVGAGRPHALEWSGASLASVFAQPANLLRPRFLGMLRELLRFNALATGLAQKGQSDALLQPLGEFLDEQRFGSAFRDWYLLPMLGCIWSSPTDQMLRFPVGTVLRFCHNHGLLQVQDRPQWWTVDGGARQYVEKITARIRTKHLNTPVRSIQRDGAGVRVLTDARAERFDKVIVATHSDQALALLHAPSPEESRILGAIRYQDNRAVLHTDTAVLPQRRAAWAAWNYERAPSDAAESSRVCLHYLINRLQPLPFTQPVLVSLNPVRAIAAERIVGEYDYAHPVFDEAAIRAQAQVGALQGQRHTYFCGAWMGYGFHEDGLKAGLAAGRALLAQAGTRASQTPLQTAMAA